MSQDSLPIKIIQVTYLQIFFFNLQTKTLEFSENMLTVFMVYRVQANQSEWWLGLGSIWTTQSVNERQILMPNYHGQKVLVIPKPLEHHDILDDLSYRLWPPHKGYERTWPKDVTEPDLNLLHEKAMLCLTCMCCSSVAREGEIPLRRQAAGARSPASLLLSHKTFGRHLIPFQISICLTKLDENDCQFKGYLDVQWRE